MNISLQDNRLFKLKQAYFIILVAIHLCIGLYFLEDYIPWQSLNFIIAVAGLPVMIYGSVSGNRTYRLLLMALAVAIFSFFINTNAIIFLALVLSLAGTIEFFYGQMSLLPILVILLISPISYIVTILSFPLRLWLTKIAAFLLTKVSSVAEATGNVILYNDNEYSVDPACMGLKMLTTSLWFSLYILFFIQKKHVKQLRLHMILLILVIVVLLNIITNISRIIILVLFDISPNSILHSFAGIACFILYTVLPLIFIINKIVLYKGTPLAENSANKHITGALNYKYALPLIALAVTGIAGITSHKDISLTQTHTPIKEVQEYSCDIYDNDIFRLKNNNVLIYIKPIASWYSSEHNPLICWIGSGYEFEQLSEKLYSNTTVYTGTLKNNEDILYTAWWYDNGDNRTISQLDWRWWMMQGESRFSVVNVTCNSSKQLKDELTKILENQSLTSMIKSM